MLKKSSLNEVQTAEKKKEERTTFQSRVIKKPKINLNNLNRRGLFSAPAETNKERYNGKGGSRAKENKESEIKRRANKQSRKLHDWRK